MENKCVFPNPNAASRIIEGRAVILTPEDSCLHLLNPLGTRIWELAKDKIRIKEIIEKICEEYEVDIEVAQRDVIEFIEDLAKNKLFIIDE